MAVITQAIKELHEQRSKLVADARKLVDAAEAAKRALSTEEKAQWDQMQSDIDALKGRMDVLGKSQEQEDEEEPEDEEGETEEEDARSAETIKLPDGRVARIVKPGKNPQRSMAVTGSKRNSWETETQFTNRQRRNAQPYQDAWVAYLRDGPGALKGKHARAIQADMDVVGGYLLAPQEFVAKLIKFVDNLVYVRQMATRYVVAEAQTLGAPSLDTDISDSDWTSELSTGTEDSSMKFGKRELAPHPLAKRIKVSNKLLRMASISGTFSNYDAGPMTGGAEGIVMQRLGYKFAITEEKTYYTGNGVQQPLGLFTASSRGISTARDIVTGNPTGFTADCFFDVKYSLKAQYQGVAEWYFNRTAMPLIRKLKDGNGQYIWSTGLAGEPDTLLERPINVSEYVPNTFTTGQYVGLLGDMSFYWIADAIELQIQRLVELYAEQNQTGFIGRLESDAMPVLEEAFTRIITS